MAGVADNVMLIESVGATDLFDSRSEGEGMQRMLHLSGVRSVLRNVCGKASFIDELKVFAASEAEVLHLSCHGNGDGIGFTNGEMMGWAELYSRLEPDIHDKTLCLSSCGATATDKLAKLFCAGHAKPLMIIGSPDSIRWDDALVSWGIVYRALIFAFDNNNGVESSALMKRSLAAVALARGCDFSMIMPMRGETQNAEPFLHWSAKECLADLCSGNTGLMQLDQFGNDCPPLSSNGDDPERT